MSATSPGKQIRGETRRGHVRGAPACPRQALLELEVHGLFGDMSPRPRT